MKTKITLTGLLATGLVLITPLAMAQAGAAGGSSSSASGSTGQKLIEMMDGLLSGNIALFVGLALAVLGLWTWLMKQETWGLVLILGGVAITAFPGIFQGIAGAMTSVLNAAGVSGTDNRAIETEKGKQI